MNVLVACEESQRVAIAFRNKGHNAFSADILECSGNHPEWHIKGDVIPLLNGFCNFTTQDGQQHYLNGKWDIILAFPPCTHLAVSGARHFEQKRKDGRQLEAIEFFCKFLTAKCDNIVIENPIGIISGNYLMQYFPDICKKYNLPMKPTQIIQPWQFGDNYNKSTCLWIKGLPNLIVKYNEAPELEWYEWCDKKGIKKRQAKWFFEALSLPPQERSKVRSKTFPGIAEAMAAQWG